MSMTISAAPIAAGTRFPGAAYVRARAEKLLYWLVAAWIFSGGIILFEPSFYELLFIPTLLVAVLAGMRFYRSTASLLVLTIVFFPFALIASFQAFYTPLTQAFIFALVTFFMLLTSVFAANYIAAAPHERMRGIINAYIVIAVLSSFVGLYGYLGHNELFTLYGRAKGMFKDPNVYGPFLILPAIFALERVLMSRRLWRIVTAALVYCILLVGVFASFSRAAWGVFAFASLFTYLMVFFFEANGRDKVRMLMMGLVGGLLLMIALGGLISLPAFNSLFEERASVAQNYDTGSTGRFARQDYAFDLALQNPLGLGPLEFEHLEIKEAPHDTYVTVLHHYGWGGGLAFYGLIFLTLIRGLAGLRYRNVRLLLIPLLAVYIPHVIEAAIIDIDHWRHVYLLFGIVWGCAALEHRHQLAEMRKTGVSAT